MEIKDVKKFVSFFNTSGLVELEVEYEGREVKRIKAVKGSVDSNTQTTQIINDVIVDDELDGQEVISPLVGTFYESPNPDVEAYVKVGDKVKAGQTLCIVEAMKVMNEIVAPVDGNVVAIKVENEQVVEYDQVLFVIA